MMELLGILGHGVGNGQWKVLGLVRVRVSEGRMLGWRRENSVSWRESC